MSEKAIITFGMKFYVPGILMHGPENGSLSAELTESFCLTLLGHFSVHCFCLTITASSLCFLWKTLFKG